MIWLLIWRGTSQRQRQGQRQLEELDIPVSCVLCNVLRSNLISHILNAQPLHENMRTRETQQAMSEGLLSTDKQLSVCLSVRLGLLDSSVSSLR